MGYTSQIPTLNATYVHADTEYYVVPGDDFHAYYTCDPSRSLIGSALGQAWASGSYVTTNQNFYITFGSGKIITRIYYENYHWYQYPDAGVKYFTLWGSNDGINWTQLVTSQATFDQHVAADVVDPKYITVNNSSSYLHYRFLFSNNWGSPYHMGVRRIELQSGSDAPPPPPTYPPVVTTAAISGITASDADGGGNVTDAGGGTVSARGVCWSTSENPTIANSKTTDGAGTGVFVSSLTGLTAPTTYYVRAYATNQYGTGYGAQTSFQTIAPPAVTTKTPASKIKATSALLRGEIVATGGADVTARGVCWNTSGSPTTADDKVNEAGSFGIGIFSEGVTGLTRNTIYYARAYATNSQGTSYGAEVTFRTLSVETAAEPKPRLTDTFYCPRASRYADPVNTNDSLPSVYGDLTDGVAGIWKLPCIDTVYSVYCFSAFPVLSVANGNSISIYNENVLVDADDYVFDESDNYESEGQIATVTFIVGLSAVVRTGAGLNDMTAGGTFSGTAKAHYRVKITTAAATDKFDWSDDNGATWKAAGVSIAGAAQALNNGVTVTFAAVTGHTLNDYFSFTARPIPGDTITARGKGKVLTGTTLMENIVDIVEDFLTGVNNFTFDLFEPTARARAENIFTSQGYAAAGIVKADATYWDIVMQMMASFLGSAYLNGNGELVLEIDDGNMSLYGATIIRRGETILQDAKQSLVNIVNQCPAHYAYNFAEDFFRAETNSSAHADAISQGIHGVREPNEPLQLYWCRNVTDAQTMQDIVVAKLKDPIYEIEIENITLKHIPLDVGDHIVTSIDTLFDKEGQALNNNYWRLISVRPDYAKAKINFRALQTPYYLTVARLLDGSWDIDGSLKCGGDRDTVVY